MTHVDAVVIEDFADLFEQHITLLVPVGEFIVAICSPRSDHRKHEYPAVAKLESIGGRVATTDLDGSMGDVELDWPIATRLEVDEAHAVRGLQEVAGVRFAVEQRSGGRRLQIGW